MLNWDDYFKRVVSLTMQFDLARKAIAAFEQTPEALEKYANGELEETQKMLLSVGGEEAERLKQEHWAFVPEGAAKYLEGMKGIVSEKVGEISNRLNQNEFIIRVTLLESFLKDAHREIVRQAPHLLKEDRTISLGKLVKEGMESVLEEEIEREVQSLDRKNIDQRASYFKERLNINWFDGTIVPLLKEVLDIRNELLHSQPDREVSEKDIGLANLVGFAIPFVTTAQAIILYPNGFQASESLDEETAAKFVKRD